MSDFDTMREAEMALAELRKHNADRNEATFEKNAARSEP